MPAEKPDRNYDSHDLNRLFAIGSIVLLLVVLGMVANDYSREWKNFQRRFQRAEAIRTEREIKVAERSLNGADMKRLKADLAKAEEEIQKHKANYEKARKNLEKIDAEHYGKDLNYRFAKANYDSKKYDTQLEIDDLRKQRRQNEASAKQAELDATRRKMDDAKLALDEVTDRQRAAAAELKAIAGSVDELQASITKMGTARDRLQKKLDSLEPGFSEWILNAPMLDFMAPTLRVQQVVLPKLRLDINFLEVPRVDRCMTCHTVIDKPGYEKGAEPFKTHPNLKLFVEASSKHPMETFGCTACHGGRDRGTSFTTATHTPDNENQRKLWEAKYGWERMKYWSTPMYARRYFYAGCYGCHARQTIIPESGPMDSKSTGGNLDRGLRTIEVSGCYGCHLIKGFEGLRKIGPDLTHISSKTNPDWAFRWIRNPLGFRTGARMPGFFQQGNQNDPADGDKPKATDLNDAEIESIVAYLWDKSEPIQNTSVHGGDPAKGQALVHSLGCFACHTDDPKEVFASRANPRAFGPNLSGSGSKTSQDWLFAWLKDPKHYWKDAYMPNLRLSDQEALDISSYLMSLRNREFEQIAIPTVSAKTRDWLVRDYLSGRMTIADTLAKMKSMNERDKKLYLGEKMINKYGCFGCHVIKGFEKAQPIGTELTEEGSKPVERLDFALEEGAVDNSLPAWVQAKLKDPRRFDRGVIKTWDEKLKMPNFYFNEQEITDVLTAIQGFAKTRMDSEMRWASTPAIEQGRRVVRDHNCLGCHIIGTQGGAIRATISDPGYFPPSLNGEGEKVIPLWLFTFLKGPTTIRPWLNVRMPTFGLQDQEVVEISRMFSSLDGAEYPFETDYFRLESAAPDIVTAGAKLFTEFKCLQCHVVGPGKPAREAADLAPNLAMARSRLRPLWIEKWLRNPEALQPGTRMPGFFPEMKSPEKSILAGNAAEQIKALRFHVLSLAPKVTMPVATASAEN